MKSKAIHHPERLIDVAGLRTTLDGLVAAPPFDVAKIRPAIVDVLKSVAEIRKNGGGKPALH